MALGISCPRFPLSPAYICTATTYPPVKQQMSAPLVVSDTRPLLTLFVAGTSTRTGPAVANLRRICEDEFPAGYELVVVDVLSQPAIAEEKKILALPTLIKEFPLPVRRIIGDFSDKEKVLAGMGLSTHQY
jgi:circadian clock protein KaiB